MICLNVEIYKNVLAKLKVECAFKELEAAEDNFIVEMKKKTPFLSSMIKLFYDGTRKTRTTCKTSTFFEDLSFLNPRSHLNRKQHSLRQKFGFCESHSTEHAIIKLVNTLLSQCEQNRYMMDIFIYLSKAFDTVNHQILFKKVKVGLSGSRIFPSLVQKMNFKIVNFVFLKNRLI